MASKSKTLAELLNGDVTIDATDIANDSVTTAKIADANVTTAKIADDAVTSAKLDTNIDIAGTLDVTGKLTADSNLLVGSGSAVGNANANELELTNPAGSGTVGMTMNVNSGSADTGNIYWRSNATNNAIQIVGDPITNYLALGTSGSTRMHIDSGGNTGIGSTTPSTYATNTKVLQLTTNANSAGEGASIRQAPWTSYQGRGYKHSEVFALSNITSSTLISQLSGTGANGFRCLFEYIVTGHTSGVANGHFWGKYYWDGGTGAPVLIQADYEENATLQITFDTSVSNRLQLFLASHNATNGFNGIAEVTYWVPIEFASNNYTTS